MKKINIKFDPAVFLGVIIFLFLTLLFYESDEIITGEDFALGDETSSLYARIGDSRIHCNDSSNSSECFQGFEKSNKKYAIVWIGNSQLHGVNQLKTTDRTSTEILHRKLLQHDIYTLTFSQANGNFQEQYLLFEYLRAQLPIKYLILALVMDDMRENNIRSTISVLLEEDTVKSNLLSTDFGQRLLKKDLPSKKDDNDFAALDQTIHKKSEKYLNKILSEHSLFWKNRAEIRNLIFFRLYVLRNFIFQIDASSVRRMIPATYEENLDALSSILRVAGREGIKVIPYIAPIRNDFPIPYSEAEYASFKSQTATIAENNGFSLINLENIVPNNLWGMKSSTVLGVSKPEIDFMHFQAPGHEKLAEAVFQQVINHETTTK